MTDTKTLPPLQHVAATVTVALISEPPEIFEILPDVRWAVKPYTTASLPILQQAWRGRSSGKIEWRAVPTCVEATTEGSDGR